MPVNDHLTWAEIKDFSAGLWTAGDWLMPDTGAQTMQDCHPVPGGGLRAFFRSHNFGTSGLSPSTEVYFGVFAHPSGGINPTSERYLIGWDTVTHVAKLYYTSTTTWTAIKSFAATSSTPTLKQTFFVTYLSGTTRKVAFNLNVGSTDDGIWIVTGGGAPSKMTVTGGTAPSGPIVVHQARLVVADGSTIRFTDPGTETFQTNNFVTVEPSGLRPNTIVMTSYEPSDLLIGKEAGPLVLITGDLSDPTVQAMDNTMTLVAGHRPAPMPSGSAYRDQGVAMVAHRDGVYMTNGGIGAQKLSPQLSPNNFSLPAQFGAWTPSWIGDCYYAEGFLFTPGAVYDTAANAWFTVGHPAGNFTAAMWAYDRGTIS